MTKMVSDFIFWDCLKLTFLCGLHSACTKQERPHGMATSNIFFKERQSPSKGRSRKYNCSLECPAVECLMSSDITPFSRNHLSLYINTLAHFLPMSQNNVEDL